MRIIRYLPLIAIATRLCCGAMTDEDREHVLVHFQMTGQWLADEVRGLSHAQLEYRASPDRWTIRECVSHLAIAEPDYWRDLMKFSKQAPDMAGKKHVLSDADILWYGIDRVEHTKTGGGHEKVETYDDAGKALKHFQDLRATMIDYIKSTQDDLRAHSYGKTGQADCWQWLLEISTHSMRHILQIREIKADPNFPKQ
ncbi:MAG TPA: DinB family protein [Bryobacteraceae bacterium]|nr:DinB family protein [Bryobacteraceae bacterium]